MDIEASSEITLDEGESDAFEESTTHAEEEQQQQQQQQSAYTSSSSSSSSSSTLASLPLDAWASIVVHMSVWDVGSSICVCKTWRASLTTDRIFKTICARYAVPEKTVAAVSYYAHFCEHAKVIVGPTLVYRHTPKIERVNLPPKFAIDLERAFEERRCSGIFVSGREGLLVADEMGISLYQLNPPFRSTRVVFERDEDSGAPVAQRRAWTDGTHAVVQSAFKGKGIKMAVKVFQVQLKPKCTGVSLRLIRDVSLAKFDDLLNDHAYLMNVFFAKSYFIFEWCGASLSTTVLCRVESGSSEATAAVRLSGVSLGTGSGYGEERMPAIALHNWKCFVLRKFPDAKDPSARSRLYVYGPKLELIHDYGPVAGENWRYPFFVKVFDPYAMLAFYTEERYHWRVYKIGGPVLVTVWSEKLPENFVSRQISGTIFDQQGVLVSQLQEKKKTTEVCISFYPFDDSGATKSKKKKDGAGPNAAWKFVIWSLDFPLTDPSKIRLWLGPTGYLVALIAPFGTAAASSAFPPQMCAISFSGRGERFLLKRSGVTPPPKQVGTEALRKELQLISDDLSMDELMALVKQAKEIQKKKGKQ